MAIMGLALAIAREFTVIVGMSQWLAIDGSDAICWWAANGDETMDFRIVKKNAQMSRYIMGMGQNSNLNHKF